MVGTRGNPPSPDGATVAQSSEQAPFTFEIMDSILAANTYDTRAKSVSQRSTESRAFSPGHVM